MRIEVIAALGILFLGGCAARQIGVVTPSTEIDTATESLFIVGMAPQNAKVTVFPGSLDDNGGYTQNFFGLATLVALPTDGYIIGRSGGGKVLAITQINWVEDKDSYLDHAYAPTFLPCEGGKTIVFEIPAGKVIYLTDIEYRNDGSQLAVKMLDRFDKAKEYVDANFPQLSGKLERWEYNMLPVYTPCTTTTYIYIPQN